MSGPKLTLNTDEVRASGLFTSKNVFDIPFFQRPYKWDSEKINQIEGDIRSLVDGQNDVHFLGAIITHQRARANATQSQIVEVIDGQQRLTTIYLYIVAAVQTFIDIGEMDEAKSHFLNFVVDITASGPGSNLRLHSSHEDRARLNEIVYSVLGTKNFEKELVGFHFRPLATSSSPSEKSGRFIRNNFNAAKRFFKKQFDEGGVDRVKAAANAILDQLTVVQIEVQDPTNGPKIFDSLNSRQQPMTPGDLIRNDIFARVADSDPDTVNRLNEEKWLPFYQSFWSSDRNYFDDYFFPYGLVHNSKVTKSQVYRMLRDSWNGKEPSIVIDELSSYQKIFMDLAAGGSRAGHSPEVTARIAKLHDSGAPSSSYPFVMRLSHALQAEEVQEAQAIAILELLDSFLTRRAICGIEPTGLHAVFKGLWNDCGEEVSTKTVAEAIRRHRTVAWPGDTEVKRAVKTREMAGSGIARYVLREYDTSLGGDAHNTVAQLEHILPQKLTNAWSSFSKDEHRDMHNRLANLLPLSGSMNASVGNEGFQHKRSRYAADSIFKSVRSFANEHEEWTPALLEARGESLADWVVNRWASFEAGAS